MNLNILPYYTFLVIFYFGFVHNSICTALAFENNCFRAAVFEHVQQSDHIHDYLHLIQLNLKVYENVTKEAANHNAKIIVFPENGIFFDIITRKDVRPFLEQIPNPSNSSVHNPCEQKDKYMNSPILYSLSCMAKNNSIYVVADMGDIQRCTNELNCPSDGFYQFNTAVIFDDTGNLIAKYHKMHPFLEPYFDLPPKPEFVTIDTPFGRLGIQICFDMIYKTPGVYLAEHSIDTILFPTWWYDELPFLTASQYQQSWAITNKVNLLAANIHSPQVGSLGSGIYSGESGAVIYTNKADGNPKLLIADIPVSSKSKEKCSANQKVIDFNQFSHKSLQNKYNCFNMSLKNTKQYHLEKPNDIIEICDNGLCCHLNYTLNTPSFENNETFYLIISNRTRDGQYPWAEEFCALTRCISNANKQCSTFTNSITKTTFNSIQLKANFSTKYIYPNVMTYNNKLIDRKEWYFSLKEPQKELILNNFNKTLIIFGLYARNYERDPPFN